MTAEIIAKEIEYPLKDILFEQAIYEADIPDLLKVLKGMDDSNQRVMLFGHNPGFTNLVNFLSGERISNLPTCGICGINFKINSWKELTHDQGRLDFFDYPKKHS
jgi:phosphohistidine phosphatase